MAFLGGSMGSRSKMRNCPRKASVPKVASPTVAPSPVSVITIGRPRWAALFISASRCIVPWGFSSHM